MHVVRREPTSFVVFQRGGGGGGGGMWAVAIHIKLELLGDYTALLEGLRSPTK